MVGSVEQILTNTQKFQLQKGLYPKNVEWVSSISFKVRVQVFLRMNPGFPFLRCTFEGSQARRPDRRGHRGLDPNEGWERVKDLVRSKWVCLPRNPPKWISAFRFHPKGGILDKRHSQIICSPMVRLGGDIWGLTHVNLIRDSPICSSRSHFSGLSFAEGSPFLVVKENQSNTGNVTLK